MPSAPVCDTLPDMKKEERIKEYRGKVESPSPRFPKAIGELSNTELKDILHRTMVRFENWRLQMESNPNPRMVHSLKSIVSIIETVSSISEMKIQYSYKDLSRQMALLIDGVAQLNLAITESLKEDDIMDESEEKKINGMMMEVIQRTVELIRLTQQAFGTSHRLKAPEADLEKLEQVTGGRKTRRGGKSRKKVSSAPGLDDGLQSRS